MSNLQQILNDNDGPDFDLNSIYLPPNQTSQSHPYTSFQVPSLNLYPELESSDSLFVQDLTNEFNDAVDSFSNFAANEIDPDEFAVGLSEWAQTMHPIGIVADDLNLSRTGSSPVGDTPVPQVEGGGNENADSEEGLICYGMLYEYDVKLISADMAEVSSFLRAAATASDTAVDTHIHHFKLSKKMESLVMCLEDGTSFGWLREGQSKILSGIMDQWPRLRFEGVAQTRLLLDRVSTINKSPERFVPIDINVYGPENLAERIGRKFSLSKLYFQRPEHYLHRFAYRNPHVITFKGLKAANRGRTDVRNNTKSDPAVNNKEERLQKIVSDVQEALNNAEELSRTEGDRMLLTNLLPHQERALTFMSRRESGEIPEEDRLWRKTSIKGQEKYVHKVSKTITTEPPAEKGGGVLADEMGMGKTLTMIALIAQTLSSAQRYVAEVKASDHQTGKARTATHSTLIVVPSALLINTWVKEINKHVGDSMTYLKYHGPSRLKDATKLSQADIVLTTYHTLAIEFSEKRSILHSINWFRVVLDEAHVIRRPATSFHKTCCELEAQSRWCLTGTPIQNHLQDIGALFVFLQAQPFHSMAQFRSSIVLPFDRREEIVKDRLVLLYKSLCISRPRSKAHLPKPIEATRPLYFTPEERDHYKSTERIMARTIKQVVDSIEQERTFGLFQTYLQLRISCNHGTWQKLFSWRRNRLRDTKEALDANLSGGTIRCGGCEQLRPSLESYKRYPDCDHFVCLDCQEDFSEDAVEAQYGLLSCPLCRIERQIKTDAPVGPKFISLAGDDDVPMGIEPTKTTELQHEEYFNATGHSTKMEQLMVDVKEQLDTTKSIIFSCWTSTLDLIEKYLGREKIEFLRIDGATPTKKRQEILDKFDDEQVRVLVMTTGTGAFGLNIMSAQRVFIVESQWNPSVENQAISRAIRIGQTANVKVVRYIMMGTVEEEMQSQQAKKRRAAQMGW